MRMRDAGLLGLWTVVVVVFLVLLMGAILVVGIMTLTGPDSTQTQAAIEYGKTLGERAP